MNDQKIDAETKGLKRRPPSPAPDDKPKESTYESGGWLAPGPTAVAKEPEPEDEPAKPTPTRRKLDPELKAMDEVCEILEAFNADQQRRILSWVHYRFGPPRDPNVPF